MQATVARRGFAQLRPLVCPASAVVVLADGTLRLSVRGQDPCVGPSGAVVRWVYGLVAISAVVSVTAYRRASGSWARGRRQAIGIVS